MSGRAWVWWLVALALGLLGLLWLDRPLAEAMQALPDAIREPFRVVTRFGRGEWYLVPTGLLAAGFALAAATTRSALRLDALRRRARLWAYLFLAVAASGLVVNALKPLFGRGRPRLLFGPLPAYGWEPLRLSVDWNSFPSGHTAIAVAFALAAGRVWPWARLPLLAWAGLIALSRLVAGSHFLGDAVGGAMLAVIVTALATRWAERRGWLPQVPLPRIGREAR